jgi:hypothetical protein
MLNLLIALAEWIEPWRFNAPRLIILGSWLYGPGL